MSERLVGTRNSPQASGFGLIELMIALALGSLLVLTVATLFSDSSRALTEINRSGRHLETGLYAMDRIAAELSLVGYWGEADTPIDADDQVYGVLRSSETGDLEVLGYPAVPPLCVGSGATGFDPRVELGFAMEFPLLSDLGSQLNATMSASACGAGATTASAASAFFAIRRASTCATGEAGVAATNRCRALENGFHLQTNGCRDPNDNLEGGEVKLHRVSDASVASLLPYTRYDCQTNAPIYRFISRIYYVSQSDELIRLRLDYVGAGAGTYVEELVAEGVEHLVFEWFIDSTGNGQYDRVETTLTPQDAGNVVGAKIWLVVRSLKPRSDFEDVATYTIAGQPWTAPDGMRNYPRALHSRMVALPNIAGRRK